MATLCFVVLSENRPGARAPQSSGPGPGQRLGRDSEELVGLHERAKPASPQLIWVHNCRKSSKRRLNYAKRAKNTLLLPLCSFGLGQRGPARFCSRRRCSATVLARRLNCENFAREREKKGVEPTRPAGQKAPFASQHKLGEPDTPTGWPITRARGPRHQLAAWRARRARKSREREREPTPARGRRPARLARRSWS